MRGFLFVRDGDLMLKAILTKYSGRLFRSRLEARWAILFDCLDIAWEYELQGFDLDGTAYLPDFVLTGPEWFFEVKGQEPTPLEQHKAKLLTAAAGKPVLLHVGRPIDPIPAVDDSPLPCAVRNMSPAKLLVFEAEDGPAEYIPAWHWNYCRRCGGKRAEGCRLLVAVTGLPVAPCIRVGMTSRCEEMREAFRYANHATFEHHKAGVA